MYGARSSSYSKVEELFRQRLAGWTGASFRLQFIQLSSHFRVERDESDEDEVNGETSATFPGEMSKVAVRGQGSSGRKRRDLDNGACRCNTAVASISRNETGKLRVSELVGSSLRSKRPASSE
jgi:hypothetical protein